MIGTPPVAHATSYYEISGSGTWASPNDANMYAGYLYNGYSSTQNSTTGLSQGWNFSFELLSAHSPS